MFSGVTWDQCCPHHGVAMEATDTTNMFLLPEKSESFVMLITTAFKPWIFIARTDAKAEAPILWAPDAKSRLTGVSQWDSLTHWKRPWGWERLKVKREEGSTGWDGWIASTTQLTWMWSISGRQWRTGNPGVLQSTESHRVGHDWATEQQPFDGCLGCSFVSCFSFKQERKE